MYAKLSMVSVRALCKRMAMENVELSFCFYFWCYLEHTLNFD